MPRGSALQWACAAGKTGGLALASGPRTAMGWRRHAAATVEWAGPRQAPRAARELRIYAAVRMADHPRSSGPAHTLMQYRSRHVVGAIMRPSRHLLARLRTPTARRRTLLAMRHPMLGAFLATVPAHLRAQPAKRGRMLAAARHQARREPAYLGAIHVGGNAPCHHLDVFFLQARGRAMVAGVRAGIAGIDAALKIQGVHRVLLILASGQSG